MSDLRDRLRDELAGWPIGSGYYSTTVSVDDARDMADAVLAVLAVPDEETVERAAQAEHWHDFEQGDAVLTWDLMTEMARGFYRDEARRMLRAAFGGEQS